MTRPYIIAEVGSNWSSLENCLISISLAKECGADAVKFQLFDHPSLYGIKSKVMTVWSNGMERDMDHSLPREWLPKLKYFADAISIDFMCSAFSPELIDVVDPFVKAHKVASAEMCHVRMLERLKEIGKPVYLSMGSHSFEEIGKALKILGDTPTTVMYCKAAYPAKYSTTAMIKLLQNAFVVPVPVGFSDHSLDVYEAPLNAAHCGAVAVEKHVNFVSSTGPDSGHSLTTEEFRDMVNALENQFGMGTMRLNSPDEEPMLTTHNRRLIATAEISFGDEFIEGKNFGTYRAKTPTEAASPFDIESFKNKRSNINLKLGEGVKLSHIMTE